MNLPYKCRAKNMVEHMVLSVSLRYLSHNFFAKLILKKVFYITVWRTCLWHLLERPHLPSITLLSNLGSISQIRAWNGPVKMVQRSEEV